MRQQQGRASVPFVRLVAMRKNLVPALAVSARKVYLLDPLECPSVTNAQLDLTAILRVCHGALNVLQDTSMNRQEQQYALVARVEDSARQ